MMQPCMYDATLYVAQYGATLYVVLYDENFSQRRAGVQDVGHLFPHAFALTRVPNF